jgi:hypothetical protein
MTIATPSPRLRASVVMLLLSALAATGASRAAAPAPETVVLPADPPTTRTAELEEIWRVGGDNEDDPLMGLVFDGARDDDGNTYLVDRQLSQVLVIGPDGGLTATLGREGDGPGELRRPHGIFVTPTGIGVVQGFPGKVTYLAADGTPEGEAGIGGDASEGGFHFMRELYRAGDRLVGASGRGSFDMEKGTSRTNSAISVMDMQGNILASFAEHTDERDFQKFVFDEAKDWAEYEAWCVSPEDLVYSAAERDRYRINVRDFAGDLVRVYERPFEVRRREKQDKDDVGSGMVIVINGRRQEPEVHALDTDPAIAFLNSAADGRIFVTTCWDVRDRLDAGTAGRFDVISPADGFVERLTLTFPGFDPTQDRLAWLDGTHFLVIRNFDAAQDAMDAGGDDDGDAEVDFADAEPLEVILVRIPG